MCRRPRFRGGAQPYEPPPGARAVATRFPFEPFDPEKLPDPKEEDHVHRLAYRAAVSGADAYRLTRAAVRRDGSMMRVGNRFVAPHRYREIAFVALGRAAISQALAVSHALGESLTQGFIAAPDPLPPEVPFRSMTVPSIGPGNPAAASVAAAVVELAQGLGADDLLLLLLSPGALGYLALPPDGESAASWAEALVRLHAQGLTGAEIGNVVRVTAAGPVGGRLAVEGAAEVETLVVDRGDGARLLGGGPTIPVQPGERESVRALLARLGSDVPTLRPESNGIAPDPTRPSGRPDRVHRPVVIAEPADALREASSAVAEKKWLPRLADLTNSRPPAAAADRFRARVEESRRDLTDDPLLTDGRGLVVFAPLTLGLPEGADEREGIGEFLARIAQGLRRREMTVAAARTSGGSPSDREPPGGVVGATPSTDRRGARALRMRPGIADVGVLATAAIPNARAR